MSSDSASPDTNTVESLTDVDDNAHNLSVVLVLEGLTDGSKHDVQPDIVDWDAALVLELIRPLSTVLVLWVLPLWLCALLEEMVVGLKCELGDGGDVVLFALSAAVRRYGKEPSYVNTPELLDRVESDNLLKKIVPVVPLYQN